MLESKEVLKKDMKIGAQHERAPDGQTWNNLSNKIKNNISHGVRSISMFS